MPQPVATANDVHDAAFGDANNSRRRPVHGWIVHSYSDSTFFVVQNQPATTQQNFIGFPVNVGPAAFGRPLSQGRGSLVPFRNDQHPVLDADPLL